MSDIIRCAWVNSDPLYIDYHDNEWSQPLRNNQALFELLMLEGMQAGLSWITILRKRENFRRAFVQFDPEKIVRFTQRKIDQLLQDESIIRNRLKINAIINNAKIYLELQQAGETFTDYIWQFVDDKSIQNHWRNAQQVPVSTPISDKMANVLKKRGFKFVGTTICYAFMQAAGLVNDHTIDCSLHNKSIG